MCYESVITDKGIVSFKHHQLIQVPMVRDVNSNVAVTQIKYTIELLLETQL